MARHRSNGGVPSFGSCFRETNSALRLASLPVGIIKDVSKEAR